MPPTSTVGVRNAASTSPPSVSRARPRSRAPSISRRVSVRRGPEIATSRPASVSVTVTSRSPLRRAQGAEQQGQRGKRGHDARCRDEAGGHRDHGPAAAAVKAQDRAPVHAREAEHDAPARAGPDGDQGRDLGFDAGRVERAPEPVDLEAGLQRRAAC